jgi:hypothetical protein
MPGKKSLFLLVLVFVAGTVRLTAQCSSTVTVQAPPTACKSGTATVAVAAVPGATYAWSVDGGTITGNANSDQITIALGTRATATASVTITALGCTAHGSGVIALHDPFAVRTSIPEGGMGTPLTIQWNYEGGSPARQTISGSDFAPLTLPADARSYTYTPATSGNKQIVIDAIVQTPPDSSPASSRRRAVAKSPASASACGELHTTVPYTVSDCVKPPVILDAPSTIVTGSSVLLSVVPQSNALITWTIVNGSPGTATGNSVMVTAGSSGSVDVSVRIARGSCSNQADRSIAIVPRPPCNDPKAVVTVGAVGCGSAMVNATFTGAPPFHGMWSDGVPFTSDTASLVRTVTAPGNYSIASFEDAACAGTASGVAVIPALGPTATTIGKVSSCIGADKVTVQFTGRPPFTATWSDGTTFSTSNMEVEHAVTNTGTNNVVSGFDGTHCPLVVFGGVVGHPTPVVEVGKSCLTPDFDNALMLFVHFTGAYTTPVSATWTDGVTISSNGTPVWRGLPAPTTTTTYTVADAHDAYCSAVFAVPPAITVYASPVPDFSLGIGNICSGATASASLATPPPAGAQVQWFADGATIVSGQGTSSIQYKAGAVGVMILGCTFTFPDPARCPTSHRQAVAVNGAPDATMSVSPGQIHAGETAIITFTMNSNVWTWNFENSLGDSITQVSTCGANNTPCHALYTSSHGTGVSKITLHATGFCPQTKDVSVDLTVVP